MNEERVKGEQITCFKTDNGLLYREFRHPKVNRGKCVYQLVAPVKLRRKIMEIAHESITGGHMGTKKTFDTILWSFYWPGIIGDVKRFCKSCDICQRAVYKETVSRVPLEKSKSGRLDEGDQVLVLLPTDNNKLLMQWKGPFVVQKKIGLSDYVLDVGGKNKICHINLLKKYIARDDHTRDMSKEASACFSTISAHLCVAKETVEDVMHAKRLTYSEKDEAVALVKQYTNVFNDIPGGTDFGHHRVTLTDNRPVNAVHNTVQSAGKIEGHRRDT
uniref:Gypsy retrotransposon integrase-like protein 1 n=1 Tax=Phallusia mammillata TaxID=59560 RepID=A0A6F9DNC8_9ASCI|nr:uncharacterized protein K02A2.6-like [Phallusia mammillata]